MLPLDRRSRLTLAAASLACWAAALVSTPQSARGSVEAEPPHAAAAAASAEPLPTRPAPVMPRRDPFAGHDETEASPAPAFTPFVATQTMAPVVRGPDAGDAVPDLGAAPALGAHPATAALHAIGLGAHPVALVGTGAGDRLVSVGDDVDGRRITRITLAGVTLDDGTVLRLVATAASAGKAAPAETPSAAPTAPPVPIPVYVVAPAARATSSAEPAR